MQANQCIEGRIPGREIRLHILVVKCAFGYQGMSGAADYAHMGFTECLNFRMMTIKTGTESDITKGGERIRGNTSRIALASYNDGGQCYRYP